MEHGRFTFEMLKEILVDRVGVPEDEVLADPRATFESMGIDSLGVTNLHVAVQQRYGFHIPDDAARRIRTVGRLIGWVNLRLTATRAKGAA